MSKISKPLELNASHDAQSIEAQILEHHAALKTLPVKPLPNSHSISLKDFALAHKLSFQDGVPGELNALYQGVLNACAKLEFTQLDCQILARAWVKQSVRCGEFDASLWPFARIDFGLPLFERTAPSSDQHFKACPQNLGLYAVLPGADWVKRMASVGVPTLQLRFKSEDKSLIEKEIEKSVRAVEGMHSHLFINDHWELALKHGAYGVHLGQEDLESLSPQDWTRMRESGLRLGISTHGYSEMIRADLIKPSYIAMGAVFPTTLKKMQTPPQGLARLRQYALLMKDYPLVAIGGITEEDFPGVLSCGVGSVAVVRAIIQDVNPEQKAKELGEIIKNQLRT